MKSSLAPRLAASSLVILAVAFPLALQPVSAAPYTPSVLPGDQATYGKVSASGSSNLVYAPPSVSSIVEPLLNVSSIALVVENVTGSRVLETRTFTYSNGTQKHDFVAGDLTAGTGNLTSWTVAGGLRKGDHIYASTASPTINDTISRSIAGVSRWVNVLNLTFTYNQARVRTVSWWDNATGVLVQFSLTSSADSGIDGNAYGSASVLLTWTNLWSDHPDFKVNANSLVLNARSGSSGIFTLKVSSLDGFAGPVWLSLEFPGEIPVYAFSIADWKVNVNTTSPATMDNPFYVPPNIAEGSYILTINAYSSMSSHPLNFTLFVSGDFDISTSGSLNILAGSSQIFTIILSSHGVLGRGLFTAALTKGAPLSVRFDESQFTLEPTQVVGYGATVSANENAAPGMYNLTVTAEKDSLIHSAVVTVYVFAKRQSLILGLEPPVFYLIVSLLAAVVATGTMTFLIRRTGTKAPRYLRRT